MALASLSLFMPRCGVMNARLCAALALFAHPPTRLHNSIIVGMNVCSALGPDEN